MVVQTLTRNLSTAMNDKLQQVKEDIRLLRSDLAELTREANDQLRVYAGETSQHVKETAETVKKSVAETGKEADRFAHEKPWLTAAIAAAAGLLLGQLLSRRRSRDEE